MRVRFWGTRGSIATPGPSTVHFGGNTACVEVITDAGQRLVIDTGTGARALGLALMREVPRPLKAAILLSHTHWDHIQGFPFFAPLFIPGNEFTICAPEGMSTSLADVLAGQMEFTYFPVELHQLPGKISFRELSEGAHEIEGVRVLAQFLNHPALCLGYRIEADGVSVVYLSDHEPFSETLWRADAPPGKIESILHPNDRRHAEFMRGADLVIHDTQYTPEEYLSKKNWGHSTYEYAVEVAAAAGARQLALIHPDPLHDDHRMEEIEQLAQGYAAALVSAPAVFCAYEGCDMIVGQLEPEALASQEAIVTIDASLDHASPRPGGRLSVLVVDDDGNVHLLAEAALGRDYTVLTAEDGEEGLSMVESNQPDMVVLDLNMPVLDGLTVLKRLRANPRLSELPILVLTASGDESSTRVAFEAGATDYLTKPFTIPQLTTRVTTCFSRMGNK
jgi:CheY-like chemotaxis protein